MMQRKYGEPMQREYGDPMRKGSLYGLLFTLLFALCVPCFLSGCRPRDETQTERERINAALDRAGLSGAISESESYPQNGGTRHQHVIRSETETYEGADTPKFVADVVFAEDGDGQFLLTVFHQSGVWEDSSRRISWADWKKQFVFAALLQGGFEQEEEIYQTFCDMEMLDGMDPVGLGAELSNGRYCTAVSSCMSQKAYDDRGFEVRRYSATLRINIYASYEQYQKQRGE